MSAIKLYDSEWYALSIQIQATESITYSNSTKTIARLDDELGWVVHPELVTLTEQAMSGNMESVRLLEKKCQAIRDELRLTKIYGPDYRTKQKP